MPSSRRRHVAALVIVALLGGCGPVELPADPPDAAAPMSTVQVDDPVARLALQDTSAEPLAGIDFDATHGSGDSAPIFGALPIEAAGSGVPAETAAFLGRWEGYGLGPPIRRDWKYVLAVTSITARDGIAYLWAATNIQFPQLVERVHFRVNGNGPDTAIEWEQAINGAYAVVSIRHASGTDALEGGTSSEAAAGRLGSVLLRRDAAEMRVDRDPAARLAAFGITWHPYDDPALVQDGPGDLVYLPPGYDEEAERRWPLVLFLHGAGDRGDNGLVLAQNSPFRFLTAGGSLDAIIVAPLLAADRPAFPAAHLDRILDDALVRYRVQPGGIAVTGLSMGGEAAYRLARRRSGEVTALAVLCGFEAGTFPASEQWGFEPIADPWSRLTGVRVRVIHGRDDLNVPLAAAEAAVDAMRDAGIGVQFDVLDHHDHDVWTDTYADPAFFEWLIELPVATGGDRD